jgi:hypothetical protein
MPLTVSEKGWVVIPADLRKKYAFDLDVLRCPRGAGWMQLIATIDDPAVIQRIPAPSRPALSGVTV